MYEKDTKGQNSELTHLDSSGAASMVDVGAKPPSKRVAIARGCVSMDRQTLAHIVAGNTKKGDVFATARLAGIMAAKNTATLIPLCHTLQLTRVDVDIEVDEALPGLRVVGTAQVTGRTGVEMEALTAVSVACLTIYDMAKALDRAMVIGDIVLLEKHGGESGSYIRDRAAGAGTGSAWG